VHTVFAAAIGAAFLGEALAAVDWLAVGLIVSANAVAVLVTPRAAASRAEDMPVVAAIAPQPN
jgi:threonine/homoserine efflux transporter RhtA